MIKGMEYLLIVARSGVMCNWCNENKRGMTLKNTYNELLHWTIKKGRENINESVSIPFEPFIYTANYKHSFVSNEHPMNATMRWIYHGYPSRLLWNRFGLTMESASIVHNIYGKEVYVIGNSVEQPEQMKAHDIPRDAFVVRFNKAISHESRIDLCVFNDVLFNTMQRQIKGTRTECVDVGRLNTECEFNSMRAGGELFTTGILTVMWLTKFFTMYESIKVIGFNMVNPGERAHYFDSETPATPSTLFAGHNAANEKRIIEEYAGYPFLNMRWIKV